MIDVSWPDFICPWPKWMRKKKKKIEQPVKVACHSEVCKSLSRTKQSHSFPFCWKCLIIHHLPSFQIQQKYTSSVIYNTTLLIWFLLFSITLQPAWQECSGKSLSVIVLFFASTARMSANDKRKPVPFISMSALKVYVALYLESI